MFIATILAVVTRDLYYYFVSISTAVIFVVKTFLTSRWYVWMILGVYLAMPIINDFVKNRGLKGVEYFLIISIAIIGLIGFDAVTHNALKWIPLVVIGILIVSWVLILIMDKIPYLNKLSGTH